MADVLEVAGPGVVGEYARLEVPLLGHPQPDHRIGAVIAPGAGPQIFAFRIGIADVGLRVDEIADLDQMLRLRGAFNPENRCSPHKIFPTAGGCVERVKPARKAAL